MRLFIAIDLAEPMKKDLVGVMHELKQRGIAGGYVPKQNLHMTLAFIGEVQSAEPVKRVMDNIPMEKSRISFTEYGNYGDLLWIGVRGNQKIKKYAADLRKALKEAGLPCDMSKFEPHVTLIRKMKGRRPADLAVPSSDMMVTKVSLMKSETKDGKRVYKEIYTV